MPPVKRKKPAWVGDEIAWDFISGGSKDSACVPFTPPVKVKKPDWQGGKAILRDVMEKNSKKILPMGHK